MASGAYSVSGSRDRVSSEGRPVVSRCSTNLTWGPDLAPIEGIDLSGRHNGYPNFLLVPDPERVFAAPWQSETLVLSDIVDEAGEPLTVSPRTILLRQTEDLRQAFGIEALVSLELEFFAF